MDDGKCMMHKLKMLQVIFSKLNPSVDNRFNKFIFIFIIILSQFNLFPQSEIHNPKSAISNLASGINRLISDPFFEKTLIAIDIFDLTDSVSLFQKNEKLLLRPASNMKLLSSSAALFNLGEYYTFRTDLYHTGCD
jgi:D-alanyl-D-alanine carboxypeptidase